MNAIADYVPLSIYLFHMQFNLLKHLFFMYIYSFSLLAYLQFVKEIHAIKLMHLFHSLKLIYIKQQPCHMPMLVIIITNFHILVHSFIFLNLNQLALYLYNSPILQQFYFIVISFFNSILLSYVDYHDLYFYIFICMIPTNTTNQVIFQDFSFVFHLILYYFLQQLNFIYNYLFAKLAYMQIYCLY